VDVVELDIDDVLDAVVELAALFVGPWLDGAPIEAVSAAATAKMTKRFISGNPPNLL